MPFVDWLFRMRNDIVRYHPADSPNGSYPLVQLVIYPVVWGLLNGFGWKVFVGWCSLDGVR